MKTCFVLWHVFVFLLMFDYGMFFTSSSPSSKESPTESPNIPTNITMTTAGSIPETQPNGPDNMTSDSTTTFHSGYEYDNASRDNDINATYLTTTHPNISIPIHHPGVKKSNPETNKDNSGPYAGGVIILIFILILIIFLLIILYVLRKKGRSYSFDLTRTEACANEYATPLREQQVNISYEPKDKDLPVCVDFTQDDKSQDKTSPIVNGCTSETTEQTAAPESEEPNLPEESSFTSSPSVTPPLKKVEFNLDLDMISGESDLNSPTSSDAWDAAQNENNNNISHAGWGPAEEIFTEISLDEPKEQA